MRYTHRYIYSSLVILAAFACWQGYVHAAATAKASLNRTKSFVGQPVKYQLEITTDTPVLIERVEFPEAVAKDFEISEAYTDVRAESVARHVRKYTLRPFTTGTIVFSPVRVQYRVSADAAAESINATAVTLEIEPRATGNLTALDIKDIKGTRHAFPWWALIACLAAGLCVWLFVRSKPGRVLCAAPSVPPRPAHEIALAELEVLRRKGLAAAGLLGELYFEMSRIVRRYVEARFSIHAPEMTTEEFFLSVKDTGVMGGAHRGLLREFLCACDMVKFAQYGPTAQEVEESFGAAQRFIEQTALISDPARDTQQGQSHNSKKI